MSVKQPTNEQCSNRSVIDENEDFITVAAWHPQWGGYCGKCLITIDKGEGCCFDVLVWHDGEFPYSDREPKEYHYCCADQVTNFGELVKSHQTKKSQWSDEDYILKEPTVLDVLKEKMEANPELRLGQIIWNHVRDMPDLYNIEDEELIKLIKEGE